nr:MAG TPA: hypothetical protein [Caudoviricetes sp.]
MLELSDSKLFSHFILQWGLQSVYRHYIVITHKK